MAYEYNEKDVARVAEAMARCVDVIYCDGVQKNLVTGLDGLLDAQAARVRPMQSLVGRADVLDEAASKYREHCAQNQADYMNGLVSDPDFRAAAMTLESYKEDFPACGEALARLYQVVPELEPATVE